MNKIEQRRNIDNWLLSNLFCFFDFNTNIKVMKKKWIILIIVISSNLLFASNITSVYSQNTDERNRVDTLATINSFSHLGDFHTINYSGDYEDIMDYLNRTVYLASLPLVVSTGLWLWVSELINRTSDESKNRTSMVMLFSPKFSARYGTLILGILIYMTILVAVFARSSLNPLSLIALISIPFALKIIIIAWNEYSNISKKREILKYAIIIHYMISMIIIASSISVFFI